MKATLLYATFALVLGAPVAFSKSELEMLRDRCAEQENQIRRLEEENSRLKGPKESPKPSTTTNRAPATSAPATATESNSKSATYTVRSGDTLERISRKTGVNVAQLGKLNNLKPTTIIHPGLVLKLPAKAPASNEASRTVSSPAPKQEKAEKTVSSTTPKPAKTEKAEKTDKIEKTVTKTTSEPTPASRTISNPAPANKTAPAPQPTAQAKAERPTEPVAKTPAATTTTGGGAKPVIRSIIIQDETNYGTFASSHGTTPDRLNELNGLSLSTSTVLAKGSELYIPAQP